MDDDFDDPELWAAADRAAAASAFAQRQPAQHSRDKVKQPTPQLLDKRTPPRAGPSSEGIRVVQPTHQLLDKRPPRTATPSEGKVVQPTPQALPQRGSGSSIMVSPRQKGNPVLQCIKSIPWEYSDILADYGLGLTTCALFLRYAVSWQPIAVLRMQDADITGPQLKVPPPLPGIRVRSDTRAPRQI